MSLSCADSQIYHLFIERHCLWPWAVLQNTTVKITTHTQLHFLVNICHISKILYFKRFARLQGHSRSLINLLFFLVVFYGVRCCFEIYILAKKRKFIVKTCQRSCNLTALAVSSQLALLLSRSNCSNVQNWDKCPFVSGDYYSAPVVVRSIVINPSVCLSVCPRAYLWNRWTDLHEILYADPLWPWLGPPLAALRYVSYVLPVLWMTSRLAVVGPMAMHGDTGGALSRGAHP